MKQTTRFAQASLPAMLCLAALPASAMKLAAPVRAVPVASALGSLGAAGAFRGGASRLSGPALKSLVPAPAVRLTPRTAIVQPEAVRLLEPAQFLPAPQFRLEGAVTLGDGVASLEAERSWRAAGMSGAASLASGLRETRRVEADPAAAALSFGRIYNDGGLHPSADSVVVAPAASARRPFLAAAMEPRPGVENRAVPVASFSLKERNAQVSGSGLGRVWAAVKSLAGLGAGLFIGSQLADILYSFVLVKAGLFGLAGTAAAVALGAYALRRWSLSKPKAGTLYPSAAGAFAAVALANLLADATGWGLYALGLGAFLGLGVGLYSGGLFGSRRP